MKLSKRCRQLVLLSGLSLSALPALSQAQDNWYVGGSINQAFVDEAGINDDDTGFKVFGGYRFSDYFAIDLVTTRANSMEFADRAQRDQFVGQIYAQFGLRVTIIALFLQMFVVSRIYMRYGVYLTAMIMPVALTVGYMLGGFFPVFSFIYLLKTIDNSLDYSVTNMTRQALFLPATNEEKSLAKTAIDTLFWRLGDLAQAGIVFVAVKWLNLGVSELAWLCAAICVVWMWIAKGIGSEYLAREVGLEGQSPILNHQLADVIIMPGAPLNVRILMDTFSGSDPSDLLTVDATLKDGEALPAWLNFSGKKWRFKGVVPNNQDDKLDVVLIAQDNAGLSVSQSFSLIPVLATE